MSFKSPMDPLELRIKAFVDDASRLMNLPLEYKPEYEMHFRELLRIIEDEKEDYTGVIPELFGSYNRVIEAAQKQSPSEIYEDLEAHAAILATVFAAREQALKNPILRKAFVKIIPRS